MLESVSVLLLLSVAVCDVDDDRVEDLIFDGDLVKDPPVLVSDLDAVGFTEGDLVDVGDTVLVGLVEAVGDKLPVVDPVAVDVGLPVTVTVGVAVGEWVPLVLLGEPVSELVLDGS